MKKLLLISMFTTSGFFGMAQPILNEVYVTPGSTLCNTTPRREFFEIYNGNQGNGNAVGNLGCYYLAVNWINGAGGANNQGFYILDFPTNALITDGYYTGSSALQFGTQTGNGNPCEFTADLDWNSGIITKYTATAIDGSGNVTAYDAGAPATSITNLFDETAPGIFVFLYNGGVLVDLLVVGAGGNQNNALAAIQKFGNLPISYNCSGAPATANVNFAGITLADMTVINPVAGTDNGYARDYDGNCAGWDKTSSPPYHTPGSTNTGSVTNQDPFWTVAYSDPAILVSTNPCLYKRTATLSGIQNVTNVNITVYRDLNGNGTYDADPTIDPVYSGPVNLTVSGNTLTTPDIIYPGGIRVFMLIRETSGCYYTQNTFLEPTCIITPVSFKSFTATRTNRTNVMARWETLTEQNSAGFSVERNVNGNWEQVAYVPTQANGGNSNSLLTYQVNDLNSAKGISQYRIRQLDLDGVSKLSEIRSVRGEGQKWATIVYPNPSVDGKVNVVFEGETAKRNVTVQDMSGRIVKQWTNYTNNNIQIENLTPGFYTIRVLNTETGEQTVEKAVVNKR